MRTVSAFRAAATFAAIAAAIVLGVARPSYAAQVFEATLLGANEVPPNGSPGTGTAVITLNADMLAVTETFSGLSATDTAAHIHCCAPAGSNAGVALPFGSFPLGVTSGTFNGTFDLTLSSTYNPAFVTANGGTAAGAESALVSGLQTGQAYVNIHTTPFPGGEIRGQLAAVPEPASLTLFGIGGLALACNRRLRRRAQPSSVQHHAA